MKHFIRIPAIIIICLSFVKPLQAQETSPQLTGIAKQIADKDFTFQADWAVPTNLPMKEITEVNYLKIIGDSASVFLPYVGDVYTPTMGGQNTVSLDVNSKLSEYRISSRKDGVDILITLKNQLDIQSLLLTVFSDGSAYLNVNSRGRAVIAYKGYIENKK